MKPDGLHSFEHDDQKANTLTSFIYKKKLLKKKKKKRVGYWKQLPHPLDLTLTQSFDFPERLICRWATFHQFNTRASNRTITRQPICSWSTIWSMKGSWGDDTISIPIHERQRANLDSDTDRKIKPWGKRVRLMKHCYYHQAKIINFQEQLALNGFTPLTAQQFGDEYNFSLEWHQTIYL